MIFALLLQKNIFHTKYLRQSVSFIFRQTLDRAASQKIPMKKMRTIFKKYLDFEEKYGDKDAVKKVKLLAASYVEKEVNA